MMYKKIKKILITIFLIMMTTSLFAVEEYVSKIYKEIDIIFVEKDDNDLKQILKENGEDKNYHLMESYTKKKVRRLIIENDYEFAMTAIYIIIDNNIDVDFEDEEVVEMYSTIAEAYEIQQQYEFEQETKRQQELAKKESELKKRREVIEKEYVVSKTEEGKTIFVSGKDARLSSVKWKTAIGLLDFNMISDFQTKQNNLGDALALEFAYNYSLDNMTVGFDVFGDVRFLTQSTMGMQIEILPKIALNLLSKNLFFTMGFSGLSDFLTEEQTLDTTQIGNFYSPTIGFQFENINIKNASLKFGADYYWGHLFKQNLKAAFGVKANVAFSFAEMEQVKLSLNVGLRDKIFIKQSGIENRFNAIFAIGVENVIR